MIEQRPHRNISVEFLGEINKPWYWIRTRAFTHFLCLFKPHNLDMYVKPVGAPLRAVQFHHQHIGIWVHSKRSVIWFPEAIGDHKGAGDHGPTAANFP